LETNCTDNYPNTFALHCPKAFHLLTGEHGEILRRLEVGWGKVSCWSTKAAISLKHVKIEEKLLRWSIGTPQCSYERYHPRPPTASSSPRLGLATPPKTAIANFAIISGMGEAMDFKFGRNIHRVHPNKSPLKILEKRERGHIQGLHKCFGYPQLSREWVKL